MLDVELDNDLLISGLGTGPSSYPQLKYFYKLYVRASSKQFTVLRNIAAEGGASIKTFLIKKIYWGRKMKQSLLGYMCRYFRFTHLSISNS